MPKVFRLPVLAYTLAMPEKAQPPFRVGFLIYTHDRTDDAKINMEIIRHVWQPSGLFQSIRIVHGFNGQKPWYPHKYLEDALVRRQNPGHFQGAAELIDAGIKFFQNKYSDYDYVIVVAADTWNVNPAYVNNIMQAMRRTQKYLATCPWGLPERNDPKDVGAAVDYFILDLKWATQYKMFPLDYEGFAKKYIDLFFYQGGNIALEKLLPARFLQATYRQYRNNVELRQLALSKWYRLTDREPVHSHIDAQGFWIRQPYWPKMGLLTHHEAEPKRAALQELGVVGGQNTQRLLQAQSVDYYNNHAGKTDR